MKSIKKDIINIPTSLLAKNVETVFASNIEAEKYIDKKNRYAKKAVRKNLRKLYPNCAYCEDSLNNLYPEIEHYRPKSIYYWFAYSWDNFLYSCSKCNRIKSNKFFIQGTQAEYNNETLQELQISCKKTDEQEKPLVLNPEQFEQTDLDKHFYFKFDGKIYPNTLQMKTTIKVCGLNRIDLINLRIKILNELKHTLSNLYLTFKNDKNIYIKARNTVLDSFEQDIDNNSDFTAWRKFIITNIKAKIN